MNPPSRSGGRETLIVPTGRRFATTEDPGVLDAETSATHHDPFTSVDLRDFLTWAVRRRLVDQHAVDLVVQTRVGGVSVATVAAAGREGAATLRQRRWRAERRLAAALASVA